MEKGTRSADLGEDKQPDFKKQKLEGEENIFLEKEDEEKADLMLEDKQSDLEQQKSEEKKAEEKKEVDDEYMEEVYKELQIYYREVEESEGFEVGEHAKMHEEMMGAIYRYYAPPEKELSQKYLDKLYEHTQMAIDKHNKDANTSYGNVKVLRANTEPVRGSFFYITFEATDNGFSETFQAKVLVGVPPTDVEVDFVRVKPKNNPALAN